MKKILNYRKGHYIVDTGINGFYAGVAGREINSVDYNKPGNEIRSDEKSILRSITGIENRRIVMLDQVHGDMVIHIVNEPSADLPSAGKADALITAIKGVMLVIRSADCVPVIIFDTEKEVLGAAHSGWKGSMLSISGRCVREMVNIYGSDPGKIRAFILPSIGPDSYEVNEDVASHFPDSRMDKNGKIYVDLWNSVRGSLKKAGVHEENIFNAGICNRINHQDFFSHRYGDIGRNLNYTFMK